MFVLNGSLLQYINTESTSLCFSIIPSAVGARNEKISLKTDRVFSLFTVLRPPQEFFTYKYGDVTIAGEGLQNLGQCSALRAFEQGGVYRALPHVLRALGSGLIRLLRQTRGCEGPILNPDPHSVASYDTQWDAEDVF
jgi:hypothetical protein